MFARICKAAYATPMNGTDPADMFRSILPLKSAYFFSGSVTDVQMYTLVVSDTFLIFAFRGTESRTDVRTDLSVWKRTLDDIAFLEDGNGDIRVHAGFLQQYNTFKFEMMAAMYKRIWKSNKQKIRVVFTGHSLGGALATLSATCAKAILKDQINAECYTFGSPRVGNAAFVNYFDTHVDASTRYVHGADIVTRMPRVMYKHVRGEHALGTATFLERTFGSVGHHALDKYIACFKAPTEPVVSPMVPEEPVVSAEEPTVPEEPDARPTSPTVPEEPVVSAEEPTGPEEPVVSAEEPTGPEEPVVSTEQAVVSLTEPDACPTVPEEPVVVSEESTEM